MSQNIAEKVVDRLKEIGIFKQSLSARQILSLDRVIYALTDGPGEHAFTNPFYFQ